MLFVGVYVPQRGNGYPFFIQIPLERRTMPRLNPDKLEKRRWLKALEIARILFISEGYFDDYLRQIEQFIKEKKKG